MIPKRHTPLSRKMQETKTILELIGEDRVTPIQVIQFKIEGTKGAIVTSVTKGDFIFKGEPNYIAAAFFNVGDNWLLKAISFSKKAELEEYMKYAPEKYPDAKIWFDESAPDWLKLDLPPGVDIDIDALKNITETVKVDNSLAEKLRADLGEKEIFESYFPDSNEGGKALDVFWPQREKDPEADKKIFDLVRNGLRKDGKGSIRQNRNQYITTIGSKYIWQSGEQNKDAIELLYYASYDPRLAGDAVYYGLSVVREKNDKIIKRLVEMCMEDVSVGRIVWGVRAVSKMQETQNVLLAYLKPYLESNAPNIKERANVMEGVLKGEIDYDKWVSEQTAKRLREGFGDKLDDIKIVLLKGNSYQRKETLNLIRRNQLSLLFDMSFEEPLRACFADGDPTVKEYAINSYRTLFSKPGECPDDILEIMDKLSTDGDRTVKNAAVIFVGSNWVWGARPQNPKAIDIMYRLSSDKDRSVRYNAVYYGLSVVENKNKKIIERLVDMAMDESNDLGRIAWGLGMGADMQTLKEVLSSYLKPNSAYSERAGQLYKEIFKIDPPGVTSNTDEQKAGAKILQTADKESLFLVNLIKSAEEGSIVSVPKGTYKIPFVIDKKLTLKGEDANNCIIEITMNGPAIVIDTKAKGKVTLENLTIKW